MVEAERNLKEVLPRYTKEDIVIAIENHGLHTTEQLVTLFKNIDSPYLGSCLDTVNSFGALENPDKVIMNLVPYIKNLHIKDFEIKRHRHQLGFEIIGTPAGKGHLNLDLLFDTINKSGNNPTAILELWTPYTDTLEETVAIEQLWLRESLDFLKSCPEISL
jgi:sugar phosphate isomerase/epimerase